MSGACVIGIDGGGSKTAGQIARIDGDKVELLAAAEAGPSNLNGLAETDVLQNLDALLDELLAANDGRPVAAAVLGIAGSEDPTRRQTLERWAGKRGFAEQLAFVHDLDPILHSAGRGNVGLIVGTGSVAGALAADGTRATVGGWGYWFGDEGSGFAIGRLGLAAVSQAADGRAPSTKLTAALLAHLGADSPRELLGRLGGNDTRRRIAGCARVVLETAAQDDVAAGIVERAAADAATLVVGAAQAAGIAQPERLVLAGSIAALSRYYRERLALALATRGLDGLAFQIEAQPAAGCLRMAADSVRNKA